MRCATCGIDPFAPAVGVLGTQATSIAMAVQVAPNTGTARWRILDALNRHEGLNDFELTDRLAIIPSTERPRRGELVNWGLVADSGSTRENDYGNDAIVWRVTDLGRWALHHPGEPLPAEPQASLF